MAKHSKKTSRRYTRFALVAAMVAAVVIFFGLEHFFGHLLFGFLVHPAIEQAIHEGILAE